MGALTHNGEVMQGLPADASQINFDKTGTDLNSTQTENAIKEVNTKVNTNASDITQLKSGLIGVGITESGTATIDLSTYTASHGNNIYYYDVSLPLTDLPSGIKLCQLVAWSGIGASAWCVLDGNTTKLRIIMDGSPVSPSTATVTVMWFK